MTDEGRDIEVDAGDDADGVVSPWARGGAMSDPDRYVAVDRRPGADDRRRGPTLTQQVAAAQHEAPVHEQPDPPPARGATRPRHRAAQLGAAVVGAVVVAVVAVSTASPGSDGDGSPSASTSTSSMPSGVGSAEESLAGRDRSESSVGSIVWERISGERSALPSRIVGGSDSLLVGFDDVGIASWESSEGRHWLPRRDFGVSDSGGVSWVVRSVAGRRQLLQVTTAGELSAAFDDTRSSPQAGFVTTYEVPDDAVDGYPVEIGGGVFARMDRRVEIPWRTVFGLADDAAYRVQVTVGDETSTFTSPGTDAEVSAELTAVADSGTDRVDLTDPDGTMRWQFDTGSLEPSDALRGSVDPSWFRFDGRRFVELDVPWTTDRVEVLSIADVVLAVPTVDVDNDSDNKLWRSVNGIDWQAIPLPAQRSARSPMPVHADINEVVVTISSGDRTSNWSTTDGETFQELPDVPGIERRSQGTFGWIAPDPRSSPRIRVSPDGEHWEPIDLSEQLGTDSARWDVAIDAIAIGPAIYITATHDETRTILVGLVITP